MYPHRWYVKQLLRPTSSDLDTTYIRSLKHKLTLSTSIAKKFYGFNYADLANSKILRFSPNNYYYVGFNIGNIILNFGFYPGIRFGAKPGRGSTRMRDIQATLIGRRVITDINYQDYSGFYLYNFKNYESSVPDVTTILIRPDISSFFFGVNTMFVFNYKKYSLRGSFSFTDIQRKSVGSFMAGLYHSYFLGTSDSSFIPLPLRNEFSPELQNINRISIYTLGLSAGYGYSFVYKRIILTAALNLGGGAQLNNYETNDKVGHTLPLNASLHVNSKAAVRYDNYRLFFGLMSSYSNNYALSPRLFNTETYTARLVLFCGYRFNIKQNGRKILRTLGLVDFAKPGNKKSPAKKTGLSK